MMSSDRAGVEGQLDVDLDAEGASRAVQSVLRRLLRAATPDEVVSEMIGLVHAFGAWTVPAQLQDARTLPVDLSMGVLPEPVLPAAEPYSAARMYLETHLPMVIEDARAVVARLDQTARAERDAAIDPLTGLLNRRGAARLQGEGRDGDAVVMLDIDHFKALNDRHGHEAGDRVLRRFAENLDACVRGADVVSRIGGEEFLIVMPATPVRACVQVVERIRQQWLAARPLPVTFSAGIAAVTDGQMEAAVAAADAALYRAKDAGRDRSELSPSAQSS